MNYRDLRDFISQLEALGELKRVRAEVSPRLEMTEVCDRVLKAGGRFVATREPVISRREDLPAFLALHPLRNFYAGEHAFLPAEYRAAIRAGGFTLRRLLGYYDSVINWYPMPETEWRQTCAAPLRHRVGAPLTGWLTDTRRPLGRVVLAGLARHQSRVCAIPGRLVTFVCGAPES